MPLVPAKCPSCGGDVQVDNSRKEAFCAYCGSKFLVESAVNYYSTKNEYHIEHADIRMEDSNGLETRLRNAESYLADHKDYIKAEELFTAITGDYAGDWRGWWGVARAMTHEFTGLDYSGSDWLVRTPEDMRQYGQHRYDGALEKVKGYVERAFHVMDAETKGRMQPVWDDYVRRCDACRDELAEKMAGQMKTLNAMEAEHSQLGQDLDKQRKVVEEGRKRCDQISGKGGKRQPNWPVLLCLAAMLVTLIWDYSANMTDWPVEVDDLLMHIYVILAAVAAVWVLVRFFTVLGKSAREERGRVCRSLLALLLIPLGIPVLYLVDEFVRWEMAPMLVLNCTPMISLGLMALLLGRTEDGMFAAGYEQERAKAELLSGTLDKKAEDIRRQREEIGISEGGQLQGGFQSF